ncbi:hypothetical protein WOLCODRAFT_61144 [Wolfiporia cocos MD-104 SS10]|uniref:THO complex subunit 1 transcription elongation factor n=1 Tax=Wolfiporia cocos (strain MD-104) TaxID=742152 RepID=A0A2H3J9G0_WOLCO|nr:hypothetical protein WOLCODRAFT_61144 [Wolfiporia cocos MD-104 SS10]
MQAIEAGVKSLLKIVQQQRPDKHALDALVADALARTTTKSSPEIRKTQWEYVLKNEIFTLAATEGSALKDPHTAYYDCLRDRLDLVLTFTEHDACEQTFPFNVLYDLLETQTITSCSHVFSWIEERADRLTEGMVPQKGKALVLLRTLNDLLRRLSKMGNMTMFCGRILTFLSRVFPLGERSGVNLRGEYGPVWDGPGSKREEDREKMEVDMKESPSSADKMETDESKAESLEEKKRQQKEGANSPSTSPFYNTFWSLQLPFSRPPVFTEPGKFAQFKEAVNKVLPVIKEATAKERALMGSKTTANTAGSLKRKRDAEDAEGDAGKDYFFAKYLTSPELLDLEVADTHFRRQFLFQLLILLDYLLLFTKSAKATWAAQRNRSMHPEFTLEPADAQWVQDTATKAAEELRQTTPSGRAFAETVHVILEREKNWVRWKNDLCAQFDKEPWSEEVTDENGITRKVGIEEATREVRKKMRVDPAPWPHTLGSAPLTEIWAMGYRDLDDLKRPFQAGDMQEFVKKIKIEDFRIETRRKKLENAERMKQQQIRARKAAAEEAAAKETAAKEEAAAKEAAPTSSQDMQSSPTPARVPPSTSAPLHPSLPAKPSTAPPAPTNTETVIASSSAPAQLSAPETKPAPERPTTPAPAPAPVLPPDNIIAQHEESKQRWTWLALRTARDQYLQHFGKIGVGDVLLLVQEIEKEKKEREERERAAASEEATQLSASQSTLAGTAGAGDERGTSPMLSQQSAEQSTAPSAGVDEARAAHRPDGPSAPKDREGDVKMDDR